MFPPPESPKPALTWVIVPTPGKVCPGAKVSRPLLAMENPVGAGALPFDPNSRLRTPEGLDVLFPNGRTCHRKSWETAFEVLLLNDDARKSSALEGKPCVAVAVPLAGITPPAAVNPAVKLAVEALRLPVKAAAVPVSPPVNAPPVSRKYRPSVKVVFRLRVPLVVMGPPVKPAPVATLVTVPPELGAELVRVTVPPRATVPPPDNPVPAFTVIEGLASIALVTPPVGILIVPLVVMGPPVKPAPVATLVTVP